MLPGTYVRLHSLPYDSRCLFRDIINHTPTTIPSPYTTASPRQIIDWHERARCRYWAGTGTIRTKSLHKSAAVTAAEVAYQAPAQRSISLGVKENVVAWQAAHDAPHHRP